MHPPHFNLKSPIKSQFIKFRLNIFFLIFLVLLASQRTYGQMPSKEVDKLMEDAMEKFDIVGAAVGIVKDGVIIHSKGYGLRSVKSTEKVNEHTQFAIASNTKAFTTAALAILVEQGKISWQDKVIDYIPKFKMYNSYVTENFNIQDLLTHRSGLGLGAGDLMFIPDGTNFTIEDILTAFQYFEPQSAFRTKYDYDNLLYIVAGEVIARVSGVSWENYVMENIIIPLSMDHTSSSFLAMRDKSNLASPHLKDKEVVRAISHFKQTGNGAAGGILSNVNDLCQWMLVHLNKGTYGKDLGDTLFSEASQREMWKIHTSFTTYSGGLYNTHFSGYGLGWELCDVNGNMLAYHGGLLPGMASQTFLVPDLKLGIVILTNTAGKNGSSPVTYIAQTILDSHLGMDDNQWLTKIHEAHQNEYNESDSITNAVWDKVESANSDHLKPQDYLGIYEDNWFGKVKVFMNDGQLWFESYRSPKLNGKMSYYKANAFAIKWEYQDMNADAFAIFSLDEEGKAQGIKMKGISPNMDFSFDFQDLNFQRIEE